LAETDASTSRGVFRLHVLQAKFGDCLVLEFGTTGAPRFMLIDGGPQGTYEAHLRPFLQKLAADGHGLELAMLSHVDNDHVSGLLDLFSELRTQSEGGEPPLVRLGSLWHNSFFQGPSDRQVEPALRAALAMAAPESAVAGHLGAILNGVSEGNRLRLLCELVKIPLNPGFSDGEIVTDTAQPFSMENLRLRVIGPSRRNLDQLRVEWLEWLDKHADEIGRERPLSVQADRSIPNLSSIAVLAEAAGKSILLTGDARGDHLLNGLEDAALLAPGGRLHVSVLKLPHHGSARNITREFFERVTADTYVVSADGRNGNPDLDPLLWLVDAARADQREIEIVITNETPSTQKLVASRSPRTSGYALRTLARGKSLVTVTLADG